MDALAAFSFPSPATSPSPAARTTSDRSSGHNARPISLSYPHSHSRCSSSSSSSSSMSTASSPQRKSMHRRTASITTIAASRQLATSISLVGAPPVPEIPAAYRMTGQSGVCAAASATPRACARMASVESIATASSSGSLPGQWSQGEAVMRGVVRERMVEAEGDDNNNDDDDDDDDDEEFWGCAGLVPVQRKMDDDTFLTPMQRRRWGVVIGGSVVV